MSNIKQVIVVRKDLNMSAGKMCAQVAHASMAFFEDCIDPRHFHCNLPLNTWAWWGNSRTKIVVTVDSFNDLILIESLAIIHRVQHVHLITDLGRTEFKEPTITCLGLGPERSELLDQITGDLKLL